MGKTLNLKLDAESEQALEKLRAQGYNLTALMRILLKNAAKEMTT